jgi:hypothetical protein
MFEWQNFENYIGPLALIFSCWAQSQTHMFRFRVIISLASLIWLYYCFMNATWTNAISYVLVLVINFYHITLQIKNGEVHLFANKAIDDENPFDRLYKEQSNSLSELSNSLPAKQKNDPPSKEAIARVVSQEMDDAIENIFRKLSDHNNKVPEDRR